MVFVLEEVSRHSVLELWGLGDGWLSRVSRVVLPSGTGRIVTTGTGHLGSRLDWSGLVWSGLVWSGLVWSGIVPLLSLR